MTTEKLTAEDQGDFVTVTVEGVDDACFTMHKHYREWGSSPEDNAPTWERLVNTSGIPENEVREVLGGLFTEDELQDPWAEEKE